MQVGYALLKEVVSSGNNPIENMEQSLEENDSTSS